MPCTLKLCKKAVDAHYKRGHDDAIRRKLL